MIHPVRHLRELSRKTQVELAEAAGTSQPTIAAYEAGRTSPTLRTLRGLADAAGLEMQVSFHPPMTAQERRSLALHAEIAKRLVVDPDGVLEKARATLGRMRRVAPSSHSLREWGVLLDRPLAELAPLLTDPAPWVRELRHVTPFAGILSAADRAEIIRSTRTSGVTRRSGEATR